MADLKPIETFYNGYRFRSRLEARWAVFFDALGIRYEYEPDGFVLSNRQPYLPDFFLPALSIYVEVKPASLNFISHPDNETVSFDETKYGFFMHDATEAGYGVWFVFGDPVDALLNEEHGGHGSNELFCNCTCSVKTFDSDAMCDCGGETIEAAECNKCRLVSGKIFAFGKDFAIWCADPIYFPQAKVLPFALMDHISATVEKVGNDSLKKSLDVSARTTLEACTKARQARFEHGEIPNTTRRY